MIIRLSSLGDVVLAAAALEVNQTLHMDWVVASEFAEILRGHPRIGRLIEFDRRRSGLLAWVRLFSDLRAHGGYSEVLDLHSTLRSLVARIIFFRSGVRWSRISKQRWRLWGFALFKRLWPKSLRPLPWVERFARAAGGTGCERPDLGHLLARGMSGPSPDGMGLFSPDGRYCCVMPGSKWPGKRWPVRRFAEVLQRLDRSMTVVVLGAPSDRESRLLVSALEQMNRPVISGIGRWDLAQTARVLSGAEWLLSNDTGLAHLAEAVGKRVVMIFGPASPEMGFGPWRAESRAVWSPLWCHPCGKDGRWCFRRGRDRFACLFGIEAPQVESLGELNPEPHELAP